MYEGTVQDLIDELGRLPGVGPKSAQRIAFHLLQADPADVERLAGAVDEPVTGLVLCAGGNPAIGRPEPEGLAAVAALVDETLTSNVRTVALMVAGLEPHLADDASVILFGSIAAERGVGYYGPAKAAVSSLAVGLAAGDGHLATGAGPSLTFLLRAWTWPPPADWPLFLATGCATTLGGLMLAQAYRLSPPALVAPFEYAAMPMAVLWGVLVFGTWPDRVAWLGIALICGAGLCALWREAGARGA